MKLLVNGLVVVVLILIFSGCKKEEEEPPFFVDPKLQEYYDAFEAEAAARGMTVDLEAAQISATFENITTPDVAAQCISQEGRRDRIRVDPAAWGSIAGLRREYLMFHELGHCYLGLGHTDDQDVDGNCVSIMASSNLVCNIVYAGQNRDDLIDELFGM